MRIVYSVGAVFGASGIGYTSYNIAKRLHQKLRLERLIVLASDSSEVNNHVTVTLPLFGRLLKKYPSQTLRDNIFDLYCSLRMVRCDIFHGWSHQALFSIRKARKMGALTYLERASTHILDQDRLLRDEYRKFGIRKPAINSSIVDKCLKEFTETDFICTPSTFTYRSLLENGIDAGKIVVVPYGVDLERFQPGKKGDDVFRVLFAGLLGFRKGVHYLLEAWSRLNLKNAQLLLAGPLLAEFKPILKKYARLSNVKYLGFIRGMELLYPRCSVFVLPSVEEGFGLVVLEAMACGVPAIVSSNTGAKDVIDDSRDGFVVTAGEAETLAERLNYLYQRREILGTMGRLARAKAESYPWKKSAEILISHYLKKSG